MPVDKSGTSSCPGCLQAKPPWACHATCWSSLRWPARRETSQTAFEKQARVHSPRIAPRRLSSTLSHRSSQACCERGTSWQAKWMAATRFKFLEPVSGAIWGAVGHPTCPLVVVPEGYTSCMAQVLGSCAYLRYFRAYLVLVYAYAEETELNPWGCWRKRELGVGEEK